MKLEMTYMILHHNSWMSVPAQAGILAGICTLWLGILLVYNIDVGDLIGRVAQHVPAGTWLSTIAVRDNA